MTLEVSEDARAITAPQMLAVEGLVAGLRDAALDRALEQAEAALRQPDAQRDDATRRTRAMYRRAGIDPTRTRPSSEALLRRVRKGERLPAINHLVDVINWCSVESQVPFGLYDRRAITAPVVVRLGDEGDWYEGIRKDRVNLGGRLVVADAHGAFGNPTSDSARAMVTETTRDVVVVLFLPVDTPAENAAQTMTVTRERLLTYAAEGR